MALNLPNLIYAYANLDLRDLAFNEVNFAVAHSLSSFTRSWQSAVCPVNSGQFPGELLRRYLFLPSLLPSSRAASFALFHSIFSRAIVVPFSFPPHIFVFSLSLSFSNVLFMPQKKCMNEYFPFVFAILRSISMFDVSCCVVLFSYLCWVAAKKRERGVGLWNLDWRLNI